jgi:nucleoside-diphosphate-sugar epimerase
LNYSTKRNLLTGASGFLGKVIFAKSNLNFITIGRSKDLDINFDLTSGIPNLPNIDIVVHAAGKAHQIPKNLEEENIFINVNVIGTKNLLAAFSKDNLPSKFIYISSVSVYGCDMGNFINEDHPLLAKDIYGKSKIIAEQLIQEWCKDHNVICTILRLPLIVGNNPPGNLGKMIKSIKNRYYFNIASGSAKKSMVLASDVAKFIPKVVEIGGIYNLTDGYNPSFYELSHMISNQIGRAWIPNLPITPAKLIAYFGDFFGDRFPLNSNKLIKMTSELTFDDSKARKTFSWDPTPVLKAFNII